MLSHKTKTPDPFVFAPPITLEDSNYFIQMRLRISELATSPTPPSVPPYDMVNLTIEFWEVP